MPSNRRARIDTREELAVVSVDRVFIEGERNTYASRGVALIVLLNGIGAMVLLALLAQNLPTPNNVKAFADAMMVFSIGAILGLTSAFIAYINRTIRLEWPEFTTWRRPLRWLAVAAAILGAACFLVGMNMARISIEAASSSTIRSKTISPQPPQTQPIEAASRAGSNRATRATNRAAATADRADRAAATRVASNQATRATNRAAATRADRATATTGAN
jgi:hypothetical protein